MQLDVKTDNVLSIPFHELFLSNKRDNTRSLCTIYYEINVLLSVPERTPEDVTILAVTV